MSRLWTNLVMLASLAVLAGVGLYFARELYDLRAREKLVRDLEEVAKNEGPCAGLERARRIQKESALAQDIDVGRMVAAKRRELAGLVTGSEDGRARKALLDADREGLVDRTLCEQIKLTRELGDSHPVLELLRYTREGGEPCEDVQALDRVLSGLTSHKNAMVRALLEEIPRLQCLPPFLSAKIANLAFDQLAEAPQSLDDLDVLRLANFLNTWGPVRAAQFSCLLEARAEPSRLATTIGCTPYQKDHVLPRYRLQKTVAPHGASLAPSGEAWLLREDGERCTVRPQTEPARALMVPCADLTFLSDVHVAVLVEAVKYGLARASLIAGVAAFDGAANRVGPSAQAPELAAWYAYDRGGAPLGIAYKVRLADLGEQLGEEVPESPLRTFCRQAGARFCYDVDWADLVSHLDGEPMVFLSRPMHVFLPRPPLSPEAEVVVLNEAFGRPAVADVQRQLYAIGDQGYLAVAVERGGVEVRWRVAPGPWRGQVFGAGEGGAAPPSARLIAAFDLRADERPELVVQRVERTLDGGVLKDSLDTIQLMELDASAQRFRSVSRLTVHEY